MGQVYTLSDHGLGRLMASETFQCLTPDQQNLAEEFIQTSFTGNNRIPMQTARMLADKLVALLGPESGDVLREEILNALEPA